VLSLCHHLPLLGLGLSLAVIAGPQLRRGLVFPCSFASLYEWAFMQLDSHLVLYAIEGALRFVFQR
jgi:hypothetical protein